MVYGTRGEIVDIVLDLRETVGNHNVGEDGRVLFRYPPSVIIFRPMGVPSSVEKYTG
jgi:hypothetical protein